MFGYQFMRVDGASMAPTLFEGEYVIVKSRREKTTPDTGDVVVMKRLGEPYMIKRVASQLDDVTFELSGDAPNSISKIDLGKIHLRQIIGKAVLRISPKGITRL